MGWDLEKQWDTSKSITTVDPDDRWDLASTTTAWLGSRRSAATRSAYGRELKHWLAWCTEMRTDPTKARRAEVDAFVAGTMSHLAPASVGRRLAAICSWYDYLISNDVVDWNPIRAVDRPHVSVDYSPTIGLTPVEVRAFLAHVRAGNTRNTARDVALFRCLADLGLRIGEALNAQVSDLRHNRGHRTIVITGKGLRLRELPIPPGLGVDLDAWIGELATRLGKKPAEVGYIFVTSRGRKIVRSQVFLLMRRIAVEAGIPSAEDISPHSFRHAAATAALDANIPLRDVQDLLGHSDPRTTRRYDRSRGDLDRSPVHALSELYGS